MAKKKWRRHFSSAERKAYWMGVGISAQIHGDGDKVRNCSNERLRKSIQAGYNADNYHDASGKLIRGVNIKK